MYVAATETLHDPFSSTYFALLPTVTALLRLCPGHDGGKVMARWQRRPYANLKDQPAAYRELVIQVTLSAVTLKAEHTWTEGAFEGLMTHTFTTWNHNLSSDDFKKASDLLPRNYRAALTLLSEEKSCIWNNQIHYQMCIHCKFVYRGDNRDDKVCQCGHARIPENLCKLVYMPISGHMRSAYGVKAAAKSMGSWWVRRNANPTQIRDSTDVIDPYHYDPTKEIGFDNDPRHWMLTHIQDPFAPYKDDMSYSCSPSLVHVLNLPAWVRQKLGYAHLLSIGPGVRKRALICGTDNFSVCMKFISSFCPESHAEQENPAKLD